MDNIKYSWNKAYTWFNNISYSKKLLLLIAFAFIIRLYVVLNATTIAHDSILYIDLSKNLASGNYDKSLNLIRPPLYPVMIWLFSYIFQDIEFAGRMVSAFGGTLTVLVSYYLGRKLFNERTGIIIALFVSIHPYMIRYSGEVLTEGMFFFFVATVSLLGLISISKNSTFFMILTSIFSALAYLTRPDGIGFIIVIFAWILFYKIHKVKEDWATRLKLLISGLSVFLIITLPYLSFIYQDTGKFEISGILSLKELSPIAFYHKININKFLDFLKYFPESYTYPFIPLFLLGIIKRYREGFSKEEYFLITILIFYYIVHLGLNPRRRYLIHLMPIALVWVAEGFNILEQWLKVKLRGKAYVTAIPLLLIITLILIQLPRGMISLHEHQLSEKLAGQWIKANHNVGSTIVTSSPLAAYYADGNNIPLPANISTMKEFINFCKERDVDFIAVYISGFEERISDFNVYNKFFLNLLTSFEDDKKGKFIIYEPIYKNLTTTE